MKPRASARRASRSGASRCRYGRAIRCAFAAPCSSRASRRASATAASSSSAGSSSTSAPRWQCRWSVRSSISGVPDSLPMTHVLAIRDFALFLAGRFCNVLAAYMQWVAIGWYLYDLTRDPMTLGWAGLASFVPIALLTLPAGDLADRVDRRLLLFVAHLIQAVAAALLLVLVALHTSVTWPFYGALLLSGTTRALAGPASKSLAPLLVPREQFAQ